MSSFPALSKRDARQRARRLLALLTTLPHADHLAVCSLAEEALGLARQSGDPLLVAETLLACNRHQTASMQPAAAWAAMREASRIFRANGLPARVAACHVVTARALYDLGEERQSAAMAHAALQEPALPAADRVRAYVLLFNANGRMGRLEEAYAFLNEQALPLARKLGDADLLSYVLQHKGWLFARLANTRQNAALPLPAHRELGDEGSADQALARALALVNEAIACLPADKPALAAEVDRQYVRGLQRHGPAADLAPERLAQLAASLTPVDPPKAANAHFSRALLLQDRGQMAQALESLSAASVLAQAHGLHGLTRDVLYMRALVFEAMGDFAAAYAALKEHSRLSLGRVEVNAGSRYAWPEARGAANPEEDLPLPPHRLRELEPPHLKRAQRWIAQRVGQPLQATDVARACGVGRRTLDAAFRAAKGTTTAAYIRRQQIEHAAEQLLHTDRPVREIALSIGYSSPAMFAREFRDRLGLSPSQWRAMSGPAAPAMADA